MMLAIALPRVCDRGVGFGRERFSHWHVSIRPVDATAVRRIVRMYQSGSHFQGFSYSHFCRQSRSPHGAPSEKTSQYEGDTHHSAPDALLAYLVHAENAFVVQLSDLSLKKSSAISPRGVASHIHRLFTLHQIEERHWECVKRGSCVSCGSRKAYDHKPRGKRWGVPQEYEMNGRQPRTVQS